MDAAPPSGDWLVRCAALSIGYRGRALAPSIELAIAPGEVIVIAGRNGSGKTTFVRTLLGLHPAVSGRVERRRELRAGYVPQLGAIDGAVPVRTGELVGWGTERGWSFLRPRRPAAAGAAVRAALADAGVSDLRSRRFNELSGGQRQRVLLARLLAGDPALAVLDEPTAAMDGAAERATFDRLHELARRRGLAALIVTHQVAVAARHADRIMFFDADAGAAGGSEIVIGPVAEIAARPRFVDLFGRIEGGAHG